MKYLKFLFILLGALCLLTLNGCSSGAGSGGSSSASKPFALDSGKAITSFSLSTTPDNIGTPGVITGQNISIIMPFGTNVTNLFASFQTSGVSVSVNGSIQNSGFTANNFTNSVDYTVTGADGSTLTYTVTVTIASDSAKEITSFSLDGTSGVITGKNIKVILPYGTDITALIATFTTSGQDISVNQETQINGQTPNNFTHPLTYVVTAADGSTQSYTVAVTIAPDSAKAITHFSLNGTPGVIAGSNIALTVPFGTDVTALVATFTTTGNDVSIGEVTQTSTLTPNNFSSPITYTVTAADGTTATYTVTVTIAADSAKAITHFSLNGTPGVITGSNIALIVPFGTDLTALVATFTTTGNDVSIGGVTQTSTLTPNDFSSPITYTVTAADNSTTTYTVTATIEPVTSYAYVANSSHDGSGEVSLLGFNESSGQVIVLTNYRDISNPASIVIDPSKHHAYVTSYYGSSIVYDINNSNGELSNPTAVAPDSSPVFSGAGPTIPFLVFNPAGTYAYFINGGNTISKYTVGSNGQLINSTFVANGNSIVFTKSGNFAYVMNSTDNAIDMYSVDSTTGELTALGTPSISTISPSFMTLNPAGTYLYVSGSNSISQFSIDNAGQLALLSSTSTAANPQLITFTPSNLYTYVLNATGYPNDNISMYSANISTGELMALTPAIFSIDAYTSSVTISPFGNYMFITNLYDGGDGVSEYSINASTGLTTLIRKIYTGYDPTSMVFLN